MVQHSFMQAYVPTSEKLKTENQTNELSRTSSSPKLSLDSWILHCFCENFPEYPRDIAIRVLIIIYSSPQHFSWFKIYKLFQLSFTSIHCSTLKLSRRNQLSSCQDEINMDGEILNALKHLKNISKSKVLLQKFIQLWRKYTRNWQKMN